VVARSGQWWGDAGQAELLEEGPLDAEGETFVRAGVLGVLDVVLTATPFPLRDFALRVVEVDVHPVDSSVMAFRRAWRDAGEKLLREAGLSAP